MIIYIIGDVLDSSESIVVHGCNCRNTMGSGFAKQVKMKCPNAYIADQMTVRGDKSKLGKFSYGIELNGMTIVNAYTQFDYGRDKVQIDYKSLEEAMIKICEHFPDEIIAMPKIGSGLAGGDWNIISEILEKVSNKYNKTFHVYSLAP